MLDYTSNLVLEHDELKQKLQKQVNKINSQLLMPDWKPRRVDYEKLRDKLKELARD